MGSTKQERQEDNNGKNEKSEMAKKESSKIVPEVKAPSQVPEAPPAFVGSLDFEKEETPKTNSAKEPEYSFGTSYKSIEKNSASTKPPSATAKAVSVSTKVTTEEKQTSARKEKSSSAKDPSEKQANASVGNGTKNLKTKQGQGAKSSSGSRKGKTTDPTIKSK